MGVQRNPALGCVGGIDRAALRAFATTFDLVEGRSSPLKAGPLPVDSPQMKLLHRATSAEATRPLRMRLAARGAVALAVASAAGFGRAEARPDRSVPSADDTIPTTTVASGPTESLSWGAGLDLGHDERTSTTVRIPNGLSPTRISAIVSFPLLDRTESFALSVAGRRLVSVRSSDVLPDGTILIEAAIPPVAAGTKTLTVDVETISDRVDAACITPDNQRVRVLDGAIAMSGSRIGPRTIAEFLASEPRRLTIVSPTAASDAAAVQLAASLTSAFGSTTHLDLRRKTPATNRAGDTLVILGLATRVGAAIDLIAPVPTLRITGSASTLLDTSRALGTREAVLADTADMRGARRTVTNPTPGTVRISTLTGSPANAAGPRLEGNGTMRWSASVPQTRFGRAIGGIDIALRGVSTPVQGSSAADVSVLWNGETIASKPLRGGPFAVNVAVPARLLARENTLAVDVRHIPSGGRCETKGNPIRVDLNPASTLTATPGQTLVPGFERFPQVFSGRLRYAVAGDPSPEGVLRQSGLIAAALQRLSPELLTTEAVTFPLSGKVSGPLAIIDGRATDAARMRAPFRFGPSRVIDVSRISVRFDIDGPVGALQAFRTNGTDVLLVAGTSSELAEAAVDAMYDRADGWFVLSDEVQVLHSEGRELIGVPTEDLVQLAPDALALNDVAATRGRRVPSWVWPVAATLLALLVLRGAVEGSRLWQLRRRAAATLADSGMAVPPRPKLERRRGDRRRLQSPTRLRAERRRGGQRRRDGS